ncbi:hypothetical protein [Lysinibacillus xylanilyticus]|uniref:hypothetical protein n=1 Tax=Lysinibacillus xylanilyticus TaxID=582475 RepID=UPI003812B80C
MFIKTSRGKCKEITKKQATTVGLVALVLSAFLTSMSQVFYAKQVHEVPTFLFTGISFFITAIYFSFFARKHKKANMWKGNINYVVKLNVASVLAFCGLYSAERS